MGTIILIAIIGSIIASALGTAWYSGSSPMGKWHMQFLGFDKLTQEEKDRMIKEAKPKMWKTYSLQMILSFLTAFFIGFVTKYTVVNGGPESAVYFYVIFAWIAFTVPMVGQNLLWSSKESSFLWKIFFSNSIYNLVTFLVTAFVATLMV